MKTDFCDWWTPEKIAEHNAEWLRQKTYEYLAHWILGVMSVYRLTSVTELGCGAGHVGRIVSDFGMDYRGIDANLDMIKLAINTNPDIDFCCQNIRDLHTPTTDLVCSFAVLKHFSNEDFPAILKKMCAVGTYGLFEMQVVLEGPSQEDSNETYWHTWTAKADLLKAIEDAGHELLEYTTYVPAGENKELAFVLTRKR